MNTTHWALLPWDNLMRSRLCSCCEPRGTRRRLRSLTPLLRHVPAPAPGTGRGGGRTLSRTQPVYWAACVSPGPQMPPQRLWIQFTPPPGARGHPCWAEWAVSGTEPADTSRISVCGRAAIREGPKDSDGVPGLHHRHSHPHQGLLQHTSLHLCHPLGQRCQSVGGGCTLTRWNQLRPSSGLLLQRLGTRLVQWDMDSHRAQEKPLLTLGPGSSLPLNLPPNCQLPIHPGKGMTLATSAPTLSQSLQAHRLQTAQGHVHTRTPLQDW